MNVIRHLLVLLYCYCGIDALFRWLMRRQCVVLAYHGVVKEGEEAEVDREGKFVLENDFVRQLAFIARHFRCVTLEQFQASLNGGKLVIQRFLAVAPVRITYTAADRKLVVEHQAFEGTSFLERMHRRRNFQHSYALEDTWAFSVDVFIAAVRRIAADG